MCLEKESPQHQRQGIIIQPGMCLEKESPQHQRQGNNCHIDADAISTLTCCLRKASALVQMHPPIPPLPSLKVSRQRSHPSRNAAALVGPVSMSINAILTCWSEGITRARPHFAMSSSSSTSTNRNRGWIHVCTWRVSRDTSSLSWLSYMYILLEYVLVLSVYC